MKQLRKAWMPWTAADQFSAEEDYIRCLNRRLKVFGDLRMVLLVAATGLLVVGYVLSIRPVMLLAMLPLALMLPLTLAVSKTEEVLNRTNNPQA